MSKSLRTLARLQPCMVRIPGVCNHNPETTVLAHIRRANIAGVGQKPPDIIGVFACSACHDAIDRRTHPVECDEGQLTSYLLDALCRQLAWYDKREIIVVVLAA